jgi:hypothetical protein
MKNKKLPLLSILLVIAIVNFDRLQGNENLRSIQIISILVIGVIIGLLLSELIVHYKSKK